MHTVMFNPISTVIPAVAVAVAVLLLPMTDLWPQSAAPLENPTQQSHEMPCLQKLSHIQRMQTS